MEENPGVWAKGGGARIIKVWVRCGLMREIDTWSQSRTGAGESAA